MKIAFLVMCIFTTSFSNINSETFKNIDDDFVIKLKYQNDVSKYIFSEDSSVAIDILEIKADGIKLNKIDDIRPILTEEASIISVGMRKDFRINMKWKKIDDYFRWNDGRGILFYDSENGYKVPFTNSFEIHKSVKKLEIKYRILLPVDTSEIEKNNLYNSIPSNAVFSKIYQKDIIFE